VLSELLNAIRKIDSGIDSELVFDNRRIRLLDIVENAQHIELKATSTVALAVKNPAEFVTHLIGLDGHVQTLVLISPESSKKEQQRVLQYFNNCELISDTSPTDITNAVQRTSSSGAPNANKLHTTKWVLATSGTTAVPKQVAHTIHSLTRTTKVGHGSVYTWGVLYDPYRFAGLQVVLQALLGNSTIVFPNLHLSIQEQLAFLVKEKVNALSATPTLWRKILMCDEAKALNLRTISLGGDGEIADNTILQALSSAYPAASIRHIYASTETGTVLSVDDGIAGFPVSFLTSPPAGVELTIRNQTLHVKNLGVHSQYMDSSESLADDDGFIDTGDHVVVNGDRVHFLGRLNGVINVGGNKVFPEHVESILFAVRNVLFARVYGQPNPIVGELVVADVVVHDNSDVEQIKMTLIRKAGEELKSYERPTHYNFVDALEHTTNGKVSRS